MNSFIHSDFYFVVIAFVYRKFNKCNLVLCVKMLIWSWVTVQALVHESQLATQWCKWHEQTFTHWCKCVLKWHVRVNSIVACHWVLLILFSDGNIISCCVFWLFSVTGPASWDARDDPAEMLHVEGHGSVGSCWVCSIGKHVSRVCNSLVRMVVSYDKKLVHYYFEKTLKSAEYVILGYHYLN